METEIMYIKKKEMDKLINFLKNEEYNIYHLPEDFIKSKYYIENKIVRMITLNNYNSFKALNLIRPNILNIIKDFNIEKITIKEYFTETDLLDDQKNIPTLYNYFKKIFNFFKSKFNNIFKKEKNV